MIKKEDCPCECHKPGLHFAHGGPCCGVEELGIDRFVITAPIMQGPFTGLLLETDEARPYAAAGPFALTYDSRELEIRRVHVDLHPYLEKIQAAYNKVAVMNLRPERITILKGEVAVHPQFEEHYMCPFCYPEMQRAVRSPKYEV